MKAYYQYFTLLILFSNTLIFGQSILEKELILSIEQGNILEFLDDIEHNNAVFISYSSSYLDNKQIYTVPAGTYSYTALFDILLVDQNLNPVGRNGKILLVPSKAQKRSLDMVPELYTLSGYVTDEMTGEHLIGASVYSPIIRQGTSTNDMGYYSLSLPKGNHVVNFSYVGYNSISANILLNKNIQRSLKLSNELTLGEVLVVDVDTNELRQKFDYVDMDGMSAYPALMGENDPLQNIQMFTGIQSGNESQGGLYVRGSGPDQNLILMDGIPIFEPKHFFGLVSIFNSDAINRINVSKAGFSPKYGGRLSSVIDVQLGTGNLSDFNASATVGMMGTKIHLEGPLIKDKSSISFSARGSWLNFLINSIAREQIGIEDSDFRLYDVNFKYSWKISNTNTLSLSSYVGNDLMYYIDKSDEIENLSLTNSNTLNWGNKLISLQWSKIIGAKLFLNTTVGAVQYDNSSKLGLEFAITTGDTTITPSYEAIARTRIKDVLAKMDFNYYHSNNTHIDFGLGASRQAYSSGIKTRTFIFNGDINEIFEGDPSTNVNEYYGYLNYRQKLLNTLTFSSGARIVNRGVRQVQYPHVEPRVNLNYVLPWKASIDLSYSRMSQFVHLLVNPGLGLPGDLWVPSTAQIKPEISDQFSFSYTHYLPFDFVFSAELYHKSLSNQLDYLSAYDIFSPIINDATIVPVFIESDDWEDRVVSGTGKAKGVELLVKKSEGKLKGWMGYTYAISDRTFDDIDDGKTYPFSLDRRHDVNLACSYQLTKQLDASLLYVYGSGHPFTLALEQYIVNGKETYILNAENRNNKRLPAYERLDIAINWKKQILSYKVIASLGVYNTLNRRNPYYVYLAKTPDKEEYTLKQVSILPVLPFLNVHIRI